MNLSTFVSIHEIQAAASGSKDTGKYDETKEAKRRSDAMFIGFYAENGPTFDASGNYLCGTCKARVGKDKCAWVEGKISMTTGSCMLYMIGPASKESDILDDRMSQKESLYTERPNVKGFGCKRCEYGATAKKEDSAGRKLWCSSWEMHVIPTACCMRNEGKDDVYPGGKIEAGGVGSGRHSSTFTKTSSGWVRTYKTDKGEVEVSKTKSITRGIGTAYYVTGHDGKTKRFNLGHGSNIEKKVAKHLQKHYGIEDEDPTRIEAGGPGSGCQGPNCGRPSTGEKKFPGPEGKPAVNYRQNAPAPLYKKEFDKAEVEKEKAGQAEMRQWQKQHPVGTQKETAINKGDEVKTLKTTKAFDNTSLEFKQFKAGTTLTVINVLPKVGSNPQLLVAQYPGRHGDMVHIPVTDVRLHRTLEGIQEKPAWKIRQEIGLEKTNVRPGKIIQQIQTPTGATYTKIKPESAGRPAGSGNISKQSSEHSLKGQFSPARGPKGNELKEIFTFDTRLKSFGQGTARATVWDASYKARTPEEVKHGTNGTTVIAWRDTKTKTGRVMEFDKDANGYIKQGSKPMQSFRNLGKMAGYLNQRYGVSMKLPGESVAKRKRK